MNYKIKNTKLIKEAIYSTIRFAHVDKSIEDKHGILQKKEMSFIPVDERNDFPIQNLPYGIFSTEDNVRLMLKLLLKFAFERSLT